jgi:hypothetical protein
MQSDKDCATLIGLNKTPCGFSNTLNKWVFNLAPIFSEKQEPIKNKLSLYPIEFSERFEGRVNLNFKVLI